MTLLTADDWLVLVALGIGLVAMAVAMRGRREVSRVPADGDSPRAVHPLETPDRGGD